MAVASRKEAVRGQGAESEASAGGSTRTVRALPVCRERRERTVAAINLTPFINLSYPASGSYCGDNMVTKSDNGCLVSVLAGALCMGLPGLAAAQSQEDGVVVLDAVVVDGQSGVADTAASAGTATASPVVSSASGGAAYVQAEATSATKGAASRLETPQVVSVVSQAQLEDQGVRTIDEATRYASGIRSQQFGANNRVDWFTIRGFPAEQDGLFLDGLSLFSTAFASWRIDPAALDRVEILKGPASVLYGGTSPGGLVNLVSKNPVTEPLFSLTAGIDEDGQAYSMIDMGGRLTEDASLSYRWNSVILGGDTYADIGEEFRGVVAPSLTWAPDADTTLTVRGYYQSEDSNNLPGFLPYDGTVRPRTFGRIDPKLFTSDPSVDEYSREQAMIGYEFEHRFDETFTVRQNLRYAHTRSTYDYVYPFGYASDLSFLNGLSGGTSDELARLHFRTTPEADSFNVDTQMEARFATGAFDHTLLAGLDYRDYRIDDVQGTSTLYSRLNINDPVYGINIGPIDNIYIDNTQTLRQTGFYAQDQIRFDRLVVTLNGRADIIDTALDNNLGADAEASDTYFSGRAGAAYVFDSGIAPFISYSRFVTPVLGVDPDTQRPFEQGEGEQYEVGLKYQPAGFDSFVTASLFDLTRSNVLVNDVAGGRAFTQIQVGEIRSRGVELEGTLALTDGLTAVAAYTAYDLEVTETSDINQGLTPVAVPEQFASLWLDYKVQSGWLKGLGVGGGVRWTGKSYADLANTLEVPDFTVFDAAISYERGNWRGQVNVANLADKRYVASCNGETSCFYGDPRKVTASLTYTW
ncbi:TonB-dependent siderophore receptor [Aurantimonas manganoxydans SI85-9A1]|uniref:TonB-dependent siderophore receptor n=2 Tax=Aurantimonas manganoxydans TaxID=651183 RepID=Q1YES0_AURMS|nr:TonB-dependent siderophore receptor [Aurantimonas manganoxydans SI85-9A1]